MNIEVGNLTEQLKKVQRSFVRYRALLFFLFIAAVYGFIVYRINTLSNLEPDEAAVAQASQGPRQPRIDPATVEKLQDLQDNSQNVQSLFNEARQNPFQE